ncbi:MAG: anthranilate phosphoribosyltransferase, partial [Clostridiales bacterium]|nr:anthranilate phosphoribosyltransferase [Clostridiales bacterium]
MSIQNYLKTIANGENLSYEESLLISTNLMETKLNPILVSALLASLKTKGETYDEVSGFAKGLKNNAIHLKSKRTNFYDIVGTGGDGSDTLNISTTCAFVLAGANVNIAKHGNKSISSKCGSADVLATLGVNILSNPDMIETQLDEIGLSFIYAPLAHPSMKNVMQVRKDLGIPTIFNIIGPLCNPLELKGQYIGVFSPNLVDIIANSMIKLGIKKGAVVYGAGGLDEASLAGNNKISFIKNEKVEIKNINGSDYGLITADNEALKGDNA